jgi:hypothetical protein
MKAQRYELVTLPTGSDYISVSYFGSARIHPRSTAMPGIYVKCPKCTGVGTVQPSGNTCDMCKGSGMVEVKEVKN